MFKETQWSNDIIQVFKEQVEFLKSEIYHKNLIIENLVNVKRCSNPANSDGSNYSDKGDGSLIRNEGTPINVRINDRLEKKTHVTISPDPSMSHSDVYAIVENDDIHYENTRDWIAHTSNRNNKRINKRNNKGKQNNIKSYEHLNRFDALGNDNDELNISNEVWDKSIDVNVVKPPEHSNVDYIKQHTRPHIITQVYPENNFIKIPIRPGVNDYNEAAKYGKTTVIFSTSITKGINVREFNKRYLSGTARFRRFHGARSKYMRHYVIPTLVDEAPKVVLIQCGGNDLQTSKSNPTPVEEIANHIIETGKLCENYGAENILIAGIIARKQGYMEKRRNDLNVLLRDMCYNLGFIFIDNDNIGQEHLFPDGVHLNQNGSDILSTNILHSLNNVF